VFKAMARLTATVVVELSDSRGDVDNTDGAHYKTSQLQHRLSPILQYRNWNNHPTDLSFRMTLAPALTSVCLYIFVLYILRKRSQGWPPAKLLNC